jgi:hypothetical protein
VTAGLVVVQAVGEPLSHDENQFIAAGWLLGEQGLLPYRDYPFHHLPNSVFVYALLGKLSPALLLNTRLLSAALGFGTAVLLYGLGRRTLRGLGFWTAWAAATAGVIALVLSPLFQYTSGRAWNHALPTFLTMAALCIWLRARRQGKPAAWQVCGALLGLAAGARASFLIVLVPFALLALWAERGPEPEVLRRRLLPFLAGAAIGLLPTLLLAGLAPRRFAYGNVIYPLQNTQYRRMLAHDDAMDLPAKLGFLGEQVLLDPPHLLLAAAGVWLGRRVLARRGAGEPKAVGAEARESVGAGDRQVAGAIWLPLGTAAALGIGALVPTPSWYQYFYAALPFVIATALGLLMIAAPRPRTVLVGAVLFIAATAALRLQILRRSTVLAHPEDWVPIQIHRLGVAIADEVGQGPVLSLSPLLPLEGGLSIYPAFATGSLTWRVSPFMQADPRRTYGVIAPADLPAYLAPDPPAAVLIGFELENEGFSLDDPGGLELPLEDYARTHGYQPVEIKCDVCSFNLLHIWMRTPESEPQG